METETSLRITRSFNAPREKVFKAWTDPQALKKWFAPADSFETPIAEVDLRVGGRYRIVIKSADGEEHRVGGVYREIHAPEKLVFTWAWESTPERESLVTLEFHDRKGACELVLTHEKFADRTARDKHREGWEGCLQRLPRAIL